MHDGVAQFNGPQNNRQLTADQLLGEMTHLMGGVSYFNRNDIDRALSQAIEDGSSAYAVTYSPSNADFQGSYRRIEVRVAGEGVLARTRPGYYATPQGSSSLSQTRDDLLSAALDNPLPYVAFRVSCGMTYDVLARRLHGKVTVDPQQPTNGSDESQEIVLAAAFGKSTRILSKWLWRIDWKTAWTNRSVSTVFDKALPEGTERVRFVVSDTAAERIGTCDLQVH